MEWIERQWDGIVEQGPLQIAAVIWYGIGMLVYLWATVTLLTGRVRRARRESTDRRLSLSGGCLLALLFPVYAWCWAFIGLMLAAVWPFVIFATVRWKRRVLGRGALASSDRVLQLTDEIRLAAAHAGTPGLDATRYAVSLAESLGPSERVVAMYPGANSACLWLTDVQVLRTLLAVSSGKPFVNASVALAEVIGHTRHGYQLSVVARSAGTLVFVTGADFSEFDAMRGVDRTSPNSFALDQAIRAERDIDRALAGRRL